MSARGARSRKAVAKDIEKKEKKAATTGKAVAPPTKSQRDAFADWRVTPTEAARRSEVPKRQLTVSGFPSRGNSESSATQGSSVQPRSSSPSQSSSQHRPYMRPPTSTSGSTSFSDGSRGKEKAVYHAKGKETKAPRGRGGGVPMKSSGSTTPLPTQFRTASARSNPTPGSKSWMNFRIWESGEHSRRPYGGFDFDEHMQTGNVLIYFKEEQINDECPIPQIRAHLDVLENSGSTWLSNALMYGRIEDGDDYWAAMDMAAESSLSATFMSPNFPMPPGQQQRMLGPTSPGGRSPSAFEIDQPYYGGVPGTRASAFLSDSRSKALRSVSSDVTSSREPTHELWFTAPTALKTPQAQRLHHVAIRNFLAMLHGKPIVGADMFEMLSTLQPEIQVMYDLDDDVVTTTPRERSVKMIIDYIIQRDLDDVRNSIKIALGLLAWAEQDNVRWKQGYLESFVHLVGVMNPQLEELDDFKRLSIVTRRNLGIAAKAMQLRTMEAEEKLTAFDFNELWMDPARSAGTPVYQSYDAFRHFLVGHYTQVFGSWPPARGSTWLNRKVVSTLQEDFGALYDYLVNRDVLWDAREERPGKKWQMKNRKHEGFKPDLLDLSLTDMLVTFDNRNGYLHIPHPYPLLPRDAPTQAKPVPQKKGLFGLKKSKTGEVPKDAKTHLQLSIIFSDATNVEQMDPSFTGSALMDAFEQFETTADPRLCSPREARLGRWILLYGILQVLSTMSVDVQSLKYTDGVPYFLNTDLKRCPDWVTNGQAEYMEASQIRSWCWQRSWDPTPIPGQPIELEGNITTLSGSLQARAAERSSPTQLQNDIQRLGEKIDSMGISSQKGGYPDALRVLEYRRDNEKVLPSEFTSKGAENGHRSAGRDYSLRPGGPVVTPLDEPLSLDRDVRSYPWRADAVTSGGKDAWM